MGVCCDQVGNPCHPSNALPVTKVFPDVVWFGEVPYQLKEIDKIVEKADLAIVVGTSSTVRGTERIEILSDAIPPLHRYIPLPALHSRSQSTEGG